jgi:peptidoglycan biosynthesis protein MviN/MurJ (putative lipid II flippase)
LSWWLESGIPGRVTWLAAVILVGVAAYFAVLFLLGVRTSDFRLRQS